MFGQEDHQHITKEATPRDYQYTALFVNPALLKSQAITCVVFSPQVMRVMGLGDAVHWWGWGITLLATSSITNIILVIILKHGQVN